MDPKRYVAIISLAFALIGNGQDPAAIEAAKAAPPSTGSPSYVGKKACAECHKENFDLHAGHLHAHTLFQMSDSKIPDIFSAKSFDAGSGHGVYTYEKNDLNEFIAKLKDAGGDIKQMPLEYVLGSGHNAQTFLTMRVNQAGETEGIEHRVSWYQDKRMDITLGHEKATPQTPGEEFGKSIKGNTLERCVYCHTTTATLSDGKIHNLVANINCEKCHGPGSEHVRQARLSPNPPPYSVGRSDWDVESEIQLCGDCHRLPRSLSQQEVRDYPDLIARFQPVGLLRSRCYLESDFQLRCTTCHNPHTTVHREGERERQVKNCISCHDESNTNHVVCPESTTTGCIECHMPKIDMTQETFFHDHWIRVRKDGLGGK